jgi:regulatory protein
MIESIEALEPVPEKSTVRVRIGAITFEIARDTAEALELRVGAPVPAALRAAIEAAADRRAAAARILRHLRVRPRTSQEVRVFLTRHGHTPETVQAVLRDLEAKGLVDDARYAAFFVQARLAHRPTGAARLRRELQARGVPRELADEAAAGAGGGNELELALAAARPRVAAAKRLGRERGMRRLAGFLARRGFSDAAVRAACLSLFADLPGTPRWQARSSLDPEET